ncbi:uncharacterized protein TNCV_1432931 [Trichonephila clavipes]|nr:uncharacterized protein TNCV_1432931 [Trichonephila clavipes]
MSCPVMAWESTANNCRCCELYGPCGSEWMGRSCHHAQTSRGLSRPKPYVTNSASVLILSLVSALLGVVVYLGYFVFILILASAYQSKLYRYRIIAFNYMRCDIENEIGPINHCVRTASVLPVILSPSSDEAHFWLNGYANKQNCRIWSEANPQVYVEAPLHPEKLTVWCALWAGGILLQKR